MAGGFDRRRLLRYGAAAFAALAVAYGARAWDQASNDITLVYRAPPGALTVSIEDADGERMRRTHFGERVSKRHTVQLPLGAFTARMTGADGREALHAFTVEGDATVEVLFHP